MNIGWIGRPRRALAATVTAAVVAMFALGSLVGTGAAPAKQSTISTKALALHDDMRVLWDRWLLHRWREMLAARPTLSALVERLPVPKTNRLMIFGEHR